MNYGNYSQSDRQQQQFRSGSYRQPKTGLAAMFSFSDISEKTQ